MMCKLLFGMCLRKVDPLDDCSSSLIELSLPFDVVPHTSKFKVPFGLDLSFPSAKTVP